MGSVTFQSTHVTVPVFPSSRQDRALDITGGHLGFICTQGGRPKNVPHPLSRFDIYPPARLSKIQ